MHEGLGVQEAEAGMSNALVSLNAEVYEATQVWNLVHHADRHGWAMLLAGFSFGVLIMVLAVAAWRYF